MKRIRSNLGCSLAVSLFLGTVLFGAAGTAIFPELSRVSAPIVCSSGNFGIVSTTYSYKPGQIGVTREMYCENPQAKTKQDITLISIVVTSLIYSALIFLVYNLWHLVQAARNRNTPPEDIKSTLSPQVLENLGEIKREDQAKDPAERLKKLETLRKNGLISQLEYDAKRSEILKEL